MLVRLLYASRASEALSPQVVDALVEQCRINNPRRGITGVLCHSGDTFIQVLEGGRQEVSRLYNTIAGDARHREVILLAYEEIAERRFCSWSMGQVNLDKVNPSILLKYCETAHMDPFNTSGKAALALLEELIASACIVGRPA